MTTSTEMNPKRRKAQDPQQLFLDTIKNLIKNLLVENINYKNNYYFDASGRYDYYKFREDTINRAKYILNRIDEMEHLVKD